MAENSTVESTPEHGGGDMKRQKIEIPEGMSKNAWKKLQKQKRWDEQKEEYRLRRREKKRAARNRKAERKVNGVTNEEDNYHQQAKRELPKTQEPSGVRIIMDCEFDELMSDKEIVSMSNQITRCYSAKRHSKYDVDLVISSFNKRLKARFEKSLLDYAKWQNMTFRENDLLTELLPKDESLANYVYLTADTENELEKLEAGHTYIIGGIVDKNRHKKLCLDKAQKLGLKVARLPIGKYIQMNSRHVLATSHVYEIMCMWFETGHNWETAFNAVLPPRKLKSGSAEPRKEGEVGEAQASEDEAEASEDDAEASEDDAEASEVGAAADAAPETDAESKA